MVYIHFPTNLTEEEEMLQRKYAKLRKKKKALFALRAPKPEPKPEVVESKKRPATEAAADATAQAKKLLKLGAIKVGTDKKDQHSFKRTKRQKETGAEKAPVGFQPFSPTGTPDVEAEKPSFENSSRPRVKDLHESFVSGGRSRRDSDSHSGPPKPEFRHKRDRKPPKRGKTIYVRGSGLTEEVLRSAFGSFGNIINTTMETDRNVGFVTFDTTEAAADAIRQMNDSKVGTVVLEVTMAIRQPTFDPPPPTIASGGVSEAWGSMSASASMKASKADVGGSAEDRVPVAYDDDDMFS